MKLPYLTSVSKPSKESRDTIFIDMDAKQKVVKLLEDRKYIDKQVDIIQLECKHEIQVIRMVVGPKSTELRKVCDNCMKPLSWPTDVEKADWVSGTS